MTEHTQDRRPARTHADVPVLPRACCDRAPPRNERMASGKIECNACPVLCQISEATPAPATAMRTRTACWCGSIRWCCCGARSTSAATGAGAVRAPASADEPADERGRSRWTAPADDEVFVTGVGSSTTYPDYKPAPFIVASKADGVDMVTVVTEGIFSYCSFKVKIDTDRFLGPEQANVRCQGEVVGHVTTAEYGSQMLSLGGVHHLTGGSKKEGRVTCEMMLALGNKQAVELRDRRRRAVS